MTAAFELALAHKATYLQYFTFENTLGIALACACRDGHIDVVHQLLQNKIDCNAVDAQGNCALAYLIVKDNTEMFLTLLEYGANINAARAIDAPKTTLLGWAMQTHNVAMTEFLLDNGADVFQPTLMTYNRNKTYFGEPLGFWLTDKTFEERGIQSSTSIVKLLLSRGATIDPNKMQPSIVLNICLFAILLDHKVVLPFKCPKGFFFEACEKGVPIQTLAFLLESGGDVHEQGLFVRNFTHKSSMGYRDNHRKVSCFHRLLLEYQTKFENAAFLLVHGARIDDAGDDVHERTPIATALEREQLDLLQFLLENGADPNKPCDSGKTPLVYAMEQTSKENSRKQYKKVDVVALLLKYGANPNKPCLQSVYPLACALISRDYYETDGGPVVDILLKNGETKIGLLDDKIFQAINRKMRGVINILEESLGKTESENAVWPDELQEETLCDIISIGNVNVARFAIEKYHFDVKQCNAKYGLISLCVDDLFATNLVQQARERSKEMVRLLLQKGADINETYDQTGLNTEAGCSNVLDAFCGSDSYHTHDIGALRFLLEDCGLDVNLRNQRGRSALEACVFSQKYCKVIQVLLEHGIEKTLSANAIQVAVANKRRDVLLLLQMYDVCMDSASEFAQCTEMREFLLQNNFAITSAAAQKCVRMRVSQKGRLTLQAVLLARACRTLKLPVLLLVAVAEQLGICLPLHELWAICRTHRSLENN